MSSLSALIASTILLSSNFGGAIGAKHRHGGAFRADFEFCGGTRCSTPVNNKIEQATDGAQKILSETLNTATFNAKRSETLTTQQVPETTTLAIPKLVIAVNQKLSRSPTEPCAMCRLYLNGRHVTTDEASNQRRAVIKEMARLQRERTRTRLLEMLAKDLQTTSTTLPTTTAIISAGSTVNPVLAHQSS